MRCFIFFRVKGNQDCDSSMINGHFGLIYDEKVGHYAHIILPWLYLFDQ